MISVSVILLLGSWIVTGCSRSEPGTTHASSSANESGITNSELQDRVRAQLDTDPAIKSARLLVDTDAEKRDVTLSGTLKSEELRDKAVALAQNAVPGITVKNAINVQPEELARTKHAVGKDTVQEKQRRHPHP